MNQRLSLQDACHAIAPRFVGKAVPLTNYIYALWEKNAQIRNCQFAVETPMQRARFLQWYIFEYAAGTTAADVLENALPLEGPLADWLRAPAPLFLTEDLDLPWQPSGFECLLIRHCEEHEKKNLDKWPRPRSDEDWMELRCWLAIRAPKLLRFSAAYLPDNSFEAIAAPLASAPANDPCATSHAMRWIWRHYPEQFPYDLPEALHGKVLFAFFHFMNTQQHDERVLSAEMRRYLSTPAPDMAAEIRLPLTGLLREILSVASPGGAANGRDLTPAVQQVLGAMALPPGVKESHAPYTLKTDAPQADIEPKAPPLISLVGMASLENGVGVAMRRCAAAIDKAGYAFEIFNKGYDSHQRANSMEFADKLTATMTAPIRIIHYNPDIALSVMPRIGFEAFGKSYRIGHCPWEFPNLSAAYRAGLLMFDEVWTASTFEETAFKKAGIRATRVGHPVPEPRIDPSLNRAYYKLPKDKYLFLFTFDKSSTVTRKNPMAVIEAFQRAFPNEDGVRLVLKSQGGDKLLWAKQDRGYEALIERAKEDPRIILIDAVFRGDEVMGLMNVCDCYISLHRSEGFGFGMAEAMVMGKPVIATRYSGNADFILPDTAFPVEATSIPLQEDDYYYSGAELTWGDPDVDQAAQHMRTVFNDRAKANAIAQAGQAFIRKEYSLEAVAARYQQRLKELDNELNAA